MQKPKKWTQVYPQGTKEGDEEQKLFISLARHPKYKWRSLSTIAKESGLSKDRAEDILWKYEALGIVFRSPTNDSNWGYWERVPEMLKDEKPVGDVDKSNRIDVSSSMFSSSSMTLGQLGGPTTMVSRSTSLTGMDKATKDIQERADKHALDQIANVIDQDNDNGMRKDAVKLWAVNAFDKSGYEALVRMRLDLAEKPRTVTTIKPPELQETPKFWNMTERTSVPSILEITQKEGYKPKSAGT